VVAELVVVAVVVALVVVVEAVTLGGRRARGGAVVVVVPVVREAAVPALVAELVVLAVPAMRVADRGDGSGRRGCRARRARGGRDSAADRSPGGASPVGPPPALACAADPAISS
jgi:hypothetical protein